MVRDPRGDYRHSHRDTVETGPAGQRVITREHWDGHVDVNAQVATVRVRAQVETVDVQTATVASPTAAHGKADVKGGTS